ncbi:hypothetical protein [Neobacillus rhizophilus]|uniref:Uncharacterized protein n=1 Tax=Neobacillus rhizophilus TaxID=2833579 RepID=A0A942U1E8_9BACI|nr:hypothetical protein [Neobacillus rhizophilus]MBS4212785.1 hypothetical protein [Neobacillus rhizophilus]
MKKICALLMAGLLLTGCSAASTGSSSDSEANSDTVTESDISSEENGIARYINSYIEGYIENVQSKMPSPDDLMLMDSGKKESVVFESLLYLHKDIAQGLEVPKYYEPEKYTKIIELYHLSIEKYLEYLHAYQQGTGLLDEPYELGSQYAKEAQAIIDDISNKEPSTKLVGTKKKDVSYKVGDLYLLKYDISGTKTLKDYQKLNKMIDPVPVRTETGLIFAGDVETKNGEMKEVDVDTIFLPKDSLIHIKEMDKESNDLALVKIIEGENKGQELWIDTSILDISEKQ